MPATRPVSTARLAADGLVIPATRRPTTCGPTRSSRASSSTRSRRASGELVVRGRIETELSAAVVDREVDSLEFLRECIGGVRFGQVTGIDGAGHRSPGRMRYAAAGDQLFTVWRRL